VRGIAKDKAKEKGVEHVITVDGSQIIPLKSMADPSTIVVKKEGATDPFIPGADYEPRIGAISVSEGGDIVKGNKLKVTFDTLLHTSLEALTSSSGRFAFMLDGRNEAQGGKTVKAYFHNASLGLSGLDLIGADEFGEI